MIRYAALASGSNGNSYYIAKGNTSVLIDAGINNKHLHLRMGALGINPATISAIFVTHEHTDHICGLSVFAKRYQIPVYLTRGTYESSRLKLPEYLVNFIKSNSVVNLQDLSVYGIPKYHDAQEPCSFLVSDGRFNISVLTDLGRICDNVKKAIRIADILFLESNYDDRLLLAGRYPYHLKNRIRGGWGHISNVLSLGAFLENRSGRLKHLILGHLSGENNTVDLVETLFVPHCTEIKLSVAKRTEPTSLFQIAEQVEAEIPVEHYTYQSIEVINIHP